MKKHLQHYGYFTGMSKYFRWLSWLSLNILVAFFLSLLFLNISIINEGKNESVRRYGLEAKSNDYKNNDSDDADSESVNSDDSANDSEYYLLHITKTLRQNPQ